MSGEKPWVGVDLDGTLAVYDHWRGEDHIGDPVPVMVERVKAILKAGKYDVRIFTARASLYGHDSERRQANIALVKGWCARHLGVELDVTSDKDFGMVALFDDRAITVEANSGRILSLVARTPIDTFWERAELAGAVHKA